MNKKVTYSDIVNALSAKTGFSKQKSEAFVKALLNQVKDELRESGKASITNFGSFKVKEVAERQGKNPQTGDPIVIPAHKRVSFSPYKSLRENVNAKYGHLESELINEEEEAKQTDESTTDLTQDTQPNETTEPENPEEEQADDVFAISTNPNAKEEASEDDEKSDDQIENEIEEDTPEQTEGDTNTVKTEPEDDIESDEAEEDVEPEHAVTDSDAPDGSERNYTNVLSILAVLMLTVIAITTVWLLVDNGSGEKRQAINGSQNNIQAGAVAQGSEVGQKASLRTYESIKSEADELEKRIKALTRQTERLRAQQSEQNIRPAEAEENPVSEEVSADEPSNQVSDTDEERSVNKRYEVQQGEWYWVISEKLYGKPRFWPLLFMENHSVNEDPDSLLKLTNIVVPVMEGSADNPSRNDYKDLAAATKMVAEAYKKAGKTEKADEYEKFARMWEKMGA